MSDKTVTVELSREELRAVAGHDYGTKPADDAHQSGMAKLDAALAAHDAAENPLGTPWEVCNCSKMRGWHVDMKGCSHFEPTKAQALLMAAAPEMADALETLMESIRGSMGENVRGSMDAAAALKKAGR